MNKETLKRDLCARLMEGVKVETITRKINEETGVIEKQVGCLVGVSKPIYIEDLIGMYEQLDFEVQFKTGEYARDFKLNEIKPILFSTSALTKPIQIASYNNGEPFVPLDIFKKKANELKNTSEDYMFDFNCVNNYIGLSRGSYDNFEGIDIFDEEHKCVNAPFWVIELLNQWHINYRLSPEQFIEVTDEFNPYL